MTAEIHEETFDWTEADIAILENILACSGEGPLQLQYVVGVWRKEMALANTSRLRKDRLSTLCGTHCDAHSSTSKEATELFQHSKLLSSQYSVKQSPWGCGGYLD